MTVIVFFPFVISCLMEKTLFISSCTSSLAKTFPSWFLKIMVVSLKEKNWLKAGCIAVATTMAKQIILFILFNCYNNIYLLFFTAGQFLSAFSILSFRSL